jgi:5'-3' exonuclease
MDCNSIIYDAFRDIEKNYSPQQGPIETLIINTVIANIKKYVYMIKPSEYLYIAFDGVAPFAKMEQQRTRRYKSQFMTQNAETSTTNQIWNSAAITPGTNFMNTLSEKI